MAVPGREGEITRYPLRTISQELRSRRVRQRHRIATFDPQTVIGIVVGSGAAAALDQADPSAGLAFQAPGQHHRLVQGSDADDRVSCFEVLVGYRSGTGRAAGMPLVPCLSVRRVPRRGGWTQGPSGCSSPSVLASGTSRSDSGRPRAYSQEWRPWPPERRSVATWF